MKPVLHGRTFLLLALLCTITLLPFLGLFDYHTKGEPRESIVAMTMLTDGNWIMPRNSYGEIAYKPPFFHWCIAVVSAIQGKVTEAGSRLPSAIALLLMTLGGYIFFLRRTGKRTALLTVLVGFTAFEIHRAGANCRVDMVLTALITGALYRLYEWYDKGMKGVAWSAVLLMGLATMTKGPVGSILPCLSMGIFLLLKRQNFWKVLLKMTVFGVFSLVFYAIWFYAAWQTAGDDFINLVYEENIGRMTGTMTYKVHVLPWTFNIISVVAGFVPWTLLFLIALFFVNWKVFFGNLWQWWTDNVGVRIRSLFENINFALAKAHDIDIFSLVCTAAIFIFYCIPESKRSVYLMPIYPFIGYFVARYILYCADTRPKPLRIFGSILAVLTSVLFIAFIIVKLQLVPESVFGSGRHAAQNIAMLHSLEDIGGVASWLLVLVPTVAGAAWWHFRKEEGTAMAAYVVALVMSIYLALDGVYTPTVLNSKSVKEIAAEIDRRAPASEGNIYEFMELSLEVKGDPLHFFELNFYLNDRIGSFYYEQPDSGFLLTTAYDLGVRGEEFAAKGYEFTLCYEAPKRGIQLYRFNKNAEKALQQQP